RSAVVAGSLAVVSTIVGAVLRLPAVTIIGIVVSGVFFALALVFQHWSKRRPQPVTHSPPRLPMPGIVERAERRAQERASGVEVKYPSGRQDAVATPPAVHIGAEVRQK